MSLNNNNIKEFKDVKTGDIIISHSVAPGIGLMPDWSIGIPLLVMSKDSDVFCVIGVGKGKRTHNTWYIDGNGYNKHRHCFEWFIGDNKIDLGPIQEQLLELPVVERILPKDQRIDEEVFNLVKDGELPSQEEMRLLLLKYHKALVTSEENMRLYNKILFDDGNARLEDSSMESAEMSYNPFLTKPGKVGKSRSMNDHYSLTEEEFNLRLKGPFSPEDMLIKELGNELKTVNKGRQDISETTSPFTFLERISAIKDEYETDPYQEEE